MKHYGDITKISGYDAPIVDIITGGSPCQDLSVAGKRAGLAGERSGLFMEQIRIIKEMREYSARISADNIRPRYMVWENVPGAFSSNNGEDFRAVLEETAKIADERVSIPRPEGGKWTKAGCIMGNGYSIAWRTHDAQYWGVPQRRRRISLVADFGGESAPEILFISDSLSRNTAESGTQGQGTARTAETSADKAISFVERAGCEGGGKGILIANERTGALSTLNNQSVCCLQDQGAGKSACNVTKDVSPTLAGTHDGAPAVSYGIDRAAYNQGANAQYNFSIDVEQIDTQTAKGPGAVASFYPQMKAESVCYREEVANTIVNGTNPGYQNGVITGVCIGNGQANQTKLSDKLGALNCMHDQQAVITAVDVRNGKEDEINGTLQAKDNGGWNCNSNSVCRQYSVVRRLTPLECTRLQGYPDGWVDIGEWTDSKGKKHKDADAPKYKALGNSIALPFWEWLAGRIVAQYDKPPTMASLFDGIGGFPLVFSRAGCTPIWASEIEEFPIAVTKRHFSERSKNNV